MMFYCILSVNYNITSELLLLLHLKAGKEDTIRIRIPPINNATKLPTTIATAIGAFWPCFLLSFTSVVNVAVVPITEVGITPGPLGLLGLTGESVGKMPGAVGWRPGTGMMQKKKKRIRTNMNLQCFGGLFFFLSFFSFPFFLIISLLSFFDNLRDLLISYYFMHRMNFRRLALYFIQANALCIRMIGTNHFHMY